MEDGHFIDDPLAVVSIKPDFSGLGLNVVHVKEYVNRAKENEHELHELNELNIRNYETGVEAT